MTSQYVNGRYAVPPAVAEKIAEHVGLDVDVLFVEIRPDGQSGFTAAVASA